MFGPENTKLTNIGDSRKKKSNAAGPILLDSNEPNHRVNPLFPVTQAVFTDLAVMHDETPWFSNGNICINYTDYGGPQAVLTLKLGHPAIRITSEISRRSSKFVVYGGAEHPFDQEGSNQNYNRLLAELFGNNIPPEQYPILWKSIRNKNILNVPYEPIVRGFQIEPLMGNLVNIFRNANLGPAHLSMRIDTSTNKFETIDLMPPIRSLTGSYKA